MNKHPIVVLHTDNPLASHDILQEQHADLSIHTCDKYEDLPALVSQTEAEVVYSLRFGLNEPFPRETLVESETVKWVSVAGSGTDHLRPWNPLSVTVSNAAGVGADMMGEYALAAILHFGLGLDKLKLAQQQKRWINGLVEPIAGKTVLIIGLGHTGKAVAARCKVMGMITLGVRARYQDTPNVDEVYANDSLPLLWSRADFIVLCVPRLDSTLGLVNSEAFAAMRPGVVLVDVSRGGVIEQQALINALDKHLIRGAALDVFETEPLPPENKLWVYDNVLITPHCSSVYAGWDLQSVRSFSQNLSRYRQGQSLHNIVDPVRGY